MADQAAGNARVEDHGHAAGRGLARAQAAQRPLRRLAADLGRVLQVGAVDLGGELVVALHLQALARQHRDAQRVARHGVAAGEAVRGRERDARVRPAGLGALRIGDPGKRPRGVFASRGAFDQGLGRRFDVVADVQLRRRLGQLVRVGQAAVRILRHRARHGQRAFHQLVERGRRGVRGRDDRLAPADEDPEAEVVAFLPLEALQLAKALGMGERDGMRVQRVGRVRACGLGLRDQAVEQVERIVCGGHGSSSLAESGGSNDCADVI